MFGNHFYHQKIRKAVAIFGRLFNNIYVIRKNSSGAAISQVKVPLSYAPKQKYLERIRENLDLDQDTQVAIKLPRMSFEITGYAYDLSRQLTKISNFNTVGSLTTNRQKFLAPVPYNINFQLNIYAKTQDDALQMVEQILPFFNPQYVLTIKPFASEYPSFKEDIPIIIQNLSFTDDFEGELTNRRTIVYTLDFEMKVNFHGPISTNSVIRNDVSNVFQIGNGLNDSDILLEKLTTSVDSGTNTNKLLSDVIGLPDSDFGFNTTVLFPLSDSV